MHPVEHFQQLRRCLADFDNLFGPVRVLSVVLQQIRSIDKERLKRSGSDRAGLLQVQIEFADLAGWLYQDMGNHYMAQYWLDRALELGHIARDTTTTAFILARKAQLSGDMHEAADAVDVADAAMALVEPTSRFAAIASAYGAHGHALAGDRDSFSKGYDRAREALDRAQPDDAPWGVFFDTAYIEVQRAQSLASLGDYRSAVAVFESFLTSLPSGFHRDHGVYLARAGLAHAGADDPEQAVALGLRALAVGAQTHSVRIDAGLAKLGVATARWRQLPSVADFHEELTIYLRATKTDLPGD
jgi:tetratricopeptide (TPR) repeat protein